MSLNDKGWRKFQIETQSTHGLNHLNCFAKL